MLSSKGQSKEEEASGEEGEQDSQGRAGQRHLLPPTVWQPIGGGRSQGQLLTWAPQCPGFVVTKVHVSRDVEDPVVVVTIVQIRAVYVEASYSFRYERWT